MPWVKLDDGMVEHLKVASLSDGAFRAHVEALSFCARNLTDGLVPEAVVKKQGWSKRSRELVAAGLWEVTPGGHAIHDYLEYNPSREQVEAEREAARRRMNRHRAPDVRPNKQRTNGEQTPLVQAKFNDPLPDPIRSDPDLDLQPPLTESRARRSAAPPDVAGNASPQTPERLVWAAHDRFHATMSEGAECSALTITASQPAPEKE